MTGLIFRLPCLSNDAGGLTQENADAEMTGFEFSSTFRASDNLTMGIAGTWLDGEYTTYSASTHVPASSITPGARGFVGGVREDLSGYRLANAPEFQLERKYHLQLSHRRKF
jgi:outer membrane receptor protein involved in Fe transport